LFIDYDNRIAHGENSGERLGFRIEEIMMDDSIDFVALSADVVSAYVGNNSVAMADLPALIAAIHGALSKAASGAVEEPALELKPAVPIKKSVTPDYIVSLEDGKKFKSLKRHLSTHYNMTPDEYRAKWGLPADYPMVAPNYAAARSELAKKMGLGQQRSKAPAAPAAPTRAKRGRKTA
jgi:predicted transcriptional regulator